MERMLIIEDEPHILMGLEDNLTLEGYAVATATDGEQGLRKAREEHFDLIILDIMLPKIDGCEVCRELRKVNVTTPILMLTAKNVEIDKVLGLELGADDYVTKPFSPRELLARVKAILRRTQRVARECETYQFGDVIIDVKRYEATKGGKKLELTALEFVMLRLFIRRRGEVLQREAILNEVWGAEVYVTGHAVDVHVANLRKKIEDDPVNPQYLLTVRGVGYKFTG
ncbi:MAG: response regulator transcription factor [Candidatus Latescibacteria bacterium]|nr:response regulator transcription factor [Candidatus Latescibacterota bacterium]